MSTERKVALSLVMLALLAWTAYCLFWLMMLVAPAIEGAAEALARTQLVIIGCWLAGVAVGGLAVLGLWRRVFDDVRRARRAMLAIAGFVVAAVAIVVLQLLGLMGLLLFAGPPLIAALLLLTAWAAGAQMRRRLGLALVGWLIGVTVVAVAWFVATDVMRNMLWGGWLGITIAAAAWWALPLVLPKSRTPAAG